MPIIYGDNLNYFEFSITIPANFTSDFSIGFFCHNTKTRQIEKYNDQVSRNHKYDKLFFSSVLW